MRGQRAPSLQIFVLDKQDLESIFTPWKLPVIPEGAGAPMQQVLAVDRTAVVLFLKQCSHQHIPHWGCTSVRAFAHSENASKKGSLMALFHKRKWCRYVLKYMRERACPSDVFRKVFTQNRERRGWPSCLSLLAVGRADKSQYSKAKMVKEQGGAMAPWSCLFVIFPREALIPYLIECAKMNFVLKVLLSQHKSAGQINTTPDLDFFFSKCF